jgi:DNA polymerase IV
MEREIIYLTVPAFPVAVERIVHPELRGRPVVVAPPAAARSVVTALSAEAWQAGIRKGMILSRAMRYCRDIVVLPPNEPLYLRASRAIFKVLGNYSPMIEPSGYGHVYLDITGTGRLWGPPRDTAWKAQQEIQRQLRMESSLGVASNKMVSRIASDIIRPVGLQDVPPGNEASFISPLPVRLLPGIGPQTEDQLEELNIRIIRELAAMRLEHLALAFGRLGFMLQQRALGIDRTPVVPARAVPALELEQVLAEDSNDYEVLQGVLSRLCDRACEQLREKKQRAGCATLSLRYADYREDGQKLKLSPPLQSSTILRTRILPVLDRILMRRTRVRSMRLRLTEFFGGMMQLDLFADPKPARSLKLEIALDALRRRYGPIVGSGQSAVGSRQWAVGSSER